MATATVSSIGSPTNNGFVGSHTVSRRKDAAQQNNREWGYMRTGTAALVLRTIFEALLYRRCPHLDQLKIEDLKEVIARRPPRTGSGSGGILLRCSFLPLPLRRGQVSICGPRN
jgi:hypothetical protein